MSASKSFQTWKEKPPGPEQLELERLFSSKEINPKDTPDTVRRTNELFMKFTPTVFAAHFRKTKAKYGLSASVDVSGSVAPKIPELGSNFPKTETITVVDDDSPINESLTTQFIDSPCRTWTYTDHQQKKDFVCVSVPMFSGCKVVNHTLSEDGTKVVINYKWPNATFKADEFFSASIAAGRMSITDPKVHAFVSSLFDSGITTNSEPYGKIIINLPCPVKRETGSWVAEKVVVGDAKMLLLQFTAYQKSLFIDDIDTTVTF